MNQDCYVIALKRDPAETERAARAWLWAWDIPASSKQAEWLRREVEGNEELLSALCWSLGRFRTWFMKRIT